MKSLRFWGKLGGWLFTLLGAAVLGAALGSLFFEAQGRRAGWLVGFAVGAVGYPLGWVRVKLSARVEAPEPAGAYPRGNGCLTAFLGAMLGLSAGLLFLLGAAAATLSPWAAGDWRWLFARVPIGRVGIPLLLVLLSAPVAVFGLAGFAYAATSRRASS